MKSLLFCLLLLFSSMSAYAQQSQQVLPRHGDPSQYYFFGIGCSDDHNCTIPALRYHTTDKQYHSVIERTTDGGLSWVQQQSPFLPQMFYRQDEWKGVLAIDSMHVIAYGDSGMIARTSDAGANWIDASIEDSRDFHAASFIDNRTGILVGGGGLAAVTTSFGDTWSIPTPLPFRWLTSVKAFGPSEMQIFSNGVGPLYKTADGWNSFDTSGWLFDPRVQHPDSLRSIHRVHWIDRDTMLAIGNAHDKRLLSDPPYVNYPFLMRSTDRGKTWYKVFERETYITNVRSFSFLSTGFGIAVGDGRGFIATTDFGATWLGDTITEDIPYAEISDVTLLNSSTALMDFSVSNFGRIYRVSLEKLSVETPWSKVQSGTRIFPNPSRGAISLQKWYTYEDDVRIIDIFGRVMMTTRITREPGTSTIDCSSLPNGTYTVLLKREGSDLPVGRFVLMK